MRVPHRVAWLLSAISLVAAAPAAAQFTPIPDPSVFSASATVIPFTHLSFLVTNVGGVTFDQGGNPVKNGAASDGPVYAPFNVNDGQGAVVDNDYFFSGAPINIGFPSPISRVSFEARFNGYGQGVTVFFFSGATPVGTATGPAPTDTSTSPNGWTFQGWDSTVTFDRISIVGPNNGYLRLDNLRFETAVAPPPPPPPPFIAHWLMDENGGTTAGDATGNGNTATLTGDVLPTWAAPAPGSGNVSSLEFDGSNYASASDNYTQHPSAALTVAAWVYPTVANGDTIGIISKPQNADGTGTGWALRIEGGYADLGANNGTYNCSWHGVSAGTLPVGQWSHIAATFDATGAHTIVKIYVNGALSDTYTDNCADGSPLSTDASPLYIGRELANFGLTRNFTGRIDDGRIYSIVLSDADIAGLVPPVARCQNVTVNAGPACTANASIDAGSDHPAGLPVTLSQSPAGPYSIGATSVGLTASIANGLSDTCSAVVTVVNPNAPVASCTAGANPDGHTPNAHAGFVTVHGSVACGSATITLGSFTLTDGETIKITVAPGASGVTYAGTVGGIRHFVVDPADAQIAVSDGTTTAVAVCSGK